MINRNKNKLQPSTGSDLAVGNDPIRNTQRSQGGNTLKSKAVRQLLDPHVEQPCRVDKGAVALGESA